MDNYDIKIIICALILVISKKIFLFDKKSIKLILDSSYQLIWNNGLRLFKKLTSNIKIKKISVFPIFIFFQNYN